VHVFQITVPSTVTRDGDINGDGVCDVADAVVLAVTLAGGLAPGSPPCARPLACDFTSDGSLDAEDLLILGAYFAGSRTALP